MINLVLKDKRSESSPRIAIAFFLIQVVHSIQLTNRLKHELSSIYNARKPC